MENKNESNENVEKEKSIKTEVKIKKILYANVPEGPKIKYSKELGEERSRSWR